MKVYQAIAAVAATMAEQGIGKDRNNRAQGYKFRGIDDVYNALGKVLAANGLVVLPRVLSRECIERQTANGKPLFYVVVEVEFDLVAAEDGTRHTVKTYGEAMDSADKATNKAMSAAYKYMAFQAFCIPTEGDNDADAYTPEIAPHKPAGRINEVEAALVLDELREGAKRGLGGLQDVFKEIPNSAAKAAVWAKHQGELKKAASDVSMFGGDPLASFPVLKKVPA